MMGGDATLLIGFVVIAFCGGMFGFAAGVLMCSRDIERTIEQRDSAVSAARKALNGWEASMLDDAKALLAIVKDKTEVPPVILPATDKRLN
jgi:hypothetical protein